MSRRLKVGTVVLLVGVLVTACGDDDASSDASGSTASGGTGTAAGDVGALTDAADDEGTVVVYTDQTNERMEAINNAFNEEYPEVEVQFFRADSSALLERIPTEYRAEQYSYDVFMSTERTYERLVADEPSTASPYAAANAALVDEQFRVDDDRFQSFGINYTGIAYNTDCVEEPPGAWEDLLAPEWKGKIAMQDPLSGGGSESWVHAMYDFFGEEEWRTYMTDLRAQEPIYDTYVTAQNLLASGEACILVAAYPDFVQPLKDEGAPVEWATIDPMVTLRYSVNLAGKPPHPNAGKLYIEFLLSEAGQRTLAESGMTVAATEYNIEAFDRLGDAETIENPFRRLEQDPEKWKGVLESVWRA